MYDEAISEYFVILSLSKPACRQAGIPNSRSLHFSRDDTEFEIASPDTKRVRNDKDVL